MITPAGYMTTKNTRIGVALVLALTAQYLRAKSLLPYLSYGLWAATVLLGCAPPIRRFLRWKYACVSVFRRRRMRMRPNASGENPALEVFSLSSEIIRVWAVVRAHFYQELMYEFCGRSCRTRCGETNLLYILIICRYMFDKGQRPKYHILLTVKLYFITFFIKHLGNAILIYSQIMNYERIYFSF